MRRRGGHPDRIRRVQREVAAGTRGQAAGWPQRVLSSLRQLARDNKLFTWALAAGAVVRLFAVLGYPGALWFAGDSYVYLGASLRPQPDLSKTTGYSLFLRLLLPFHSLTLVVVLQHLMGLADGVMIYALLRHNRVSKKWATIASLPMLLDGYVIEDEHLIMTEALFTFLAVVALLLVLWRPKVSWWRALAAGLLLGYAAIVHDEGAIVVAVFPLFLLIRDWKSLRGWLAAILVGAGCLIPVGAYASWFHSHTGHYGLTMTNGFYLWGRVSSFANCAVIKPAGEQAVVCPTQPIADRTPPGNYIWHAPYVHQDMNSIDGPASYAGNKLLMDFSIHAIEAQPLDYAKTVVKGVLLAFGFPRINYPGAGTVYYYSFHLHYKTAKYNLLPPDNHSWIPGGTAYQDWLSYGHQQPGVVNEIFAIPVLAYQRLVFTYGPLLALIFLAGLGGVIGVRRRGRDPRTFRLRWEPRGTSMLPWITAVALLVFPTAYADFDYRYLISVLPFACIAAGLAFAPARKNAPAPSVRSAPSVPDSTEPRQAVPTPFDH
jgi:hypothetical protein